MAFVFGNSLNGDIVAFPAEQVGPIRLVLTSRLLGPELWEKQTEKWRKEHPSCVVVEVLGTRVTTEIFYPYPFEVVASAMCKARDSKGYATVDFVRLDDLKEYSETDFLALLEGDKEVIKESEILPIVLQAKA